jgi:hypothetical protein
LKNETRLENPLGMRQAEKFDLIFDLGRHRDRVDGNGRLHSSMGLNRRPGNLTSWNMRLAIF